MHLDRLLRAMVQFKASDLHVQTGSPPTLRINNDITPLDLPPVTADEVAGLVRDVATETSTQEIETQLSADFAYAIPDLGRFRINVFRERGSLALVARLIPLQMPKFDELHLPDVIEDIAGSERGLVLVTGTTGSGKSTTLASIIDHLNHTRKLRILTIEDPIEFRSRFGQEPDRPAGTRDRHTGVRGIAETGVASGS